MGEMWAPRDRVRGAGEDVRGGSEVGLAMEEN